MIASHTSRMTRGFSLLLAAAVSLAAFTACHAQSKEKEAPGAPGTIESKIKVKPPEPPFVPTQEVINLLDALEKQAKETKSVQAALRFDLNNTLTNDAQTRFGKLIYEAGPPAKFAAHFTTLRVDNKAIPQNRWYVFDGIWLVEKLEDKKQFFKWQVVPPNAPPAAANPLGLGQGPFVVPVSLRKDLVLARFEVTLVPADAKNDPKDSVHLQLKPRKGQRINYLSLDAWYHKETLQLMRARTINSSDSESIITLSEVKVNEKVEGNPMDTAEPKEQGWDVQVTPWEEK